jgi:hypothetical protein
VVTQIKQHAARKKLTSPPLHKLDGKHLKANGVGKDHDAGARVAGPVSLVDRGKDLLADEAGSVAAATAIVVGAALIEVELIPGLIIGAGAILLGKLFPELGSYVRPAIKGALRAGFSMGQKAREVMAEASEQVHDLVAEVKHEQEEPVLDKKIRPVKEAVVAGEESPVH